MLVSLGLVFAVLAGISLSKSATSSGLQKQITQAQNEIRTLSDGNQALEAMLMASTDGEQIRNYVVNELGLLKIQAEAIHSIHLPDTRPMGGAASNDVQMRRTEGGGFFAMLASLLRQIPF